MSPSAAVGGALSTTIIWAPRPAPESSLMKVLVEVGDGNAVSKFRVVVTAVAEVFLWTIYHEVIRGGNYRSPTQSRTTRESTPVRSASARPTTLVYN